jgi:hypothetical protein
VEIAYGDIPVTSVNVSGKVVRNGVRVLRPIIVK